MKHEVKRLFFGFEADAPWPNELPKGRILAPECRHMTMAFLGNIVWPDLQELLPSLPLPQFQVGVAGVVDRCLFLPERHPNVVSWHVRWMGICGEALLHYQTQLVKFLSDANYQIDSRPFLPHITVARTPFDINQWQQAFRQLPVLTYRLHLYESVGNLLYQPLWSHELIPPFREISHTADIAFKVAGRSIQQIGVNAQAALCFKCPSLIPYLSSFSEDCTLDDIVISLNDTVSRADMAFGSPLKAISFHGEIMEDNSKILYWEMVVDV